MFFLPQKKSQGFFVDLTFGRRKVRFPRHELTFSTVGIPHYLESKRACWKQRWVDRNFFGGSVLSQMDAKHASKIVCWLLVDFEDVLTWPMAKL